MSQPSFEKQTFVSRAHDRGTAVLPSCSECKGLIEIDDIEGHKEWHAKIDELIEWAQSVSKLFGGSNGPNE